MLFVTLCIVRHTLYATLKSSRKADYFTLMSSPKLLEQSASRVSNTLGAELKSLMFNWIRRFILFHNKRHPAYMAEPEIRQFLSLSAARSKVSASTQTVARSGLLFLYIDVLKRELSFIDQIERAEQPACCQPFHLEPKSNVALERLSLAT